MPGIFDGAGSGPFDPSIFDTKIQALPTTTARVAITVPARKTAVEVET